MDKKAIAAMWQFICGRTEEHYLSEFLSQLVGDAGEDDESCFVNVETCTEQELDVLFVLTEHSGAMRSVIHQIHEVAKGGIKKVTFAIAVEDEYLDSEESPA